MRKVNSVDLAGLNDFFDTAQMNMKNTKPKLNMTHDDIIRMAREVHDGMVFMPEDLERFAALVAAAEREACAKVAEDYWSEGYGVLWRAGREVAAEIRARGEQ